MWQIFSYSYFSLPSISSQTKRTRKMIFWLSFYFLLVLRFLKSFLILCIWSESDIPFPSLFCTVRTTFPSFLSLIQTKTAKKKKVDWNDVQYVQSWGRPMSFWVVMAGTAWVTRNLCEFTPSFADLLYISEEGKEKLNTHKQKRKKFCSRKLETTLNNFTVGSINTSSYILYIILI